jgi:copper(I)-binding protein
VALGFEKVASGDHPSDSSWCPAMRKDVTPVSDRARPRRTRAPLVVSALIAGVALAGCGAGQITQTAEQVAAVEGANAGAGEIALRNATIEFDAPVHGAAIYPAGTDAPLEMTIVNSGSEADRLIAASSPIAASVQISGVLQIPGGQALAIEGAPASVAAPVPADAAATPEPAPGGTPATTPPAEEAEPGAGHIVLTGLSEEIQAGRSYPLVLTFERAGEVRFDVPVANPDTLREDAAH